VSRLPLDAGEVALAVRVSPSNSNHRTDVGRVQSQSERMTALVEDLLLLARLDEGQPLKLREMDLAQLVVETVSDEQVMAPGPHLAAGAAGRAGSGRREASQLRQVLINLLSNARKHTPAGTTVVTGVGASPEGAAVVTVTVTSQPGRTQFAPQLTLLLIFRQADAPSS
jgi:two-component system OmpR family sensor kinase